MPPRRSAFESLAMNASIRSGAAGSSAMHAAFGPVRGPSTSLDSPIRTPATGSWTWAPAPAPFSSPCIRSSRGSGPPSASSYHPVPPTKPAEISPGPEHPGRWFSVTCATCRWRRAPSISSSPTRHFILRTGDAAQATRGWRRRRMPFMAMWRTSRARPPTRATRAVGWSSSSTPATSPPPCSPSMRRDSPCAPCASSTTIEAGHPASSSRLEAPAQGSA